MHQLLSIISLIIMIVKSLCISIVILQVIVLASSALLSPVQGLYVDRQQLWSIGGLPHPYVSGGYSFPFSWRYTLAGIINFGVVLNGYVYSTDNSVLSYTAELANPSTSGATLVFTPFGTQASINFASFTIIVLTESNNYTQIIVSQQRNLPFTAGFTGWQVNSAKFTFNINGQPEVYSFLQWFVMWDTSPVTTIVSISSYSIPSSTTINIGLMANSTLFRSIKVCVLIVDRFSVSPNIGKYASTFVTGNYLPTDPAFPGFGIPNIFFGFLPDYLCFHSTDGGVFMNAGPGVFEARATDDGTRFTNFIYSRAQIYLVGVKALCLGQVPPSTFITDTLYHYDNCSNHIDYCVSCISSTVCLQCQYPITLVTPNQTACLFCNSYMPYCLACSAYTTCLQCEPAITLLALDQQSCPLCRDVYEYCNYCFDFSTCHTCYLGNSIFGGCSKVPGCTQAVQVYESGGVHSFCGTCDGTEFILDTDKQACVCKEGFLAGHHCTTVIGCITAIKVGNTTQCIACNPLQYFLLNQTTHLCYCMNGLSFQSDTCQDTCGDGKVITVDCDDGNIVNGDGCSSSCKVEKFHRCYNGSFFSPSECQYIGPIKVKLIKTQKIDNVYQGAFTFSFTPALPLLNKFNITDYFSFRCDDAVFQIVNWTYSDGKATVHVDYQTDLEDRSAIASFAFNQHYIRYYPLQIAFTVKSLGDLLIIGEDESKLTFLQYFMLASTLLAVAILAFSSWLQKMVGVQFINLLQIIYYLHFTASNYTKSISTLQYLSLVGLDNLFSQKKYQNIDITSEYKRINWSIEHTETILLGLAAVMTALATITLVIFLLLKNGLSVSRQRANCFLRFIYDELLFPTVLASFIPAFLIFFILSSAFSAKDSFMANEFRSIAVLVTLFIFSLVFFQKLTDIFMKKLIEVNIKESSKRKKAYIMTFSLYLFIEVAIIQLWVVNGVALRQTFLCFSVLMLFWQIVIRPYRTILDNVSICMNVGLSILFQIYLILRLKQIVVSNELNDILVCFCLVGLISVCGICSLIRVIRMVLKKIKRKEPQRLQQRNQGDNGEGNLNTMNRRERKGSRSRNLQEINQDLRAYFEKGYFFQQSFLKKIIEQEKDEARRTLIENKRAQFRRMRQVQQYRKKQSLENQ